jgi:putative redox protein
MEVQEITLDFGMEYDGVAHGPNGDIAIGGGENKFAPYNLLFSALGSCMYANFLEIARKKRISYDAVRISVRGAKRDAIPATLKWVTVRYEVVNPMAGSEGGLEKTAALSAEYCSIFQTLAHVAEMKCEVTFSAG